MIRKASCCCGQCAIVVEGEPLLNAICHCGNCKKRTGSAFGWSVYFTDDQVKAKEGDFAVYEIAGSKLQRRWFCRTCGTTLFWSSTGRAGQTGVAGGCFVDQPLDAPSVTVSNPGRYDWVGLPAEWRTSL